MSQKLITLSEQYRSEGNIEFKNRSLLQALSLYAKSVLYAPNDSITLCLAFGNRSAALFELNLYEECIRDIERALISIHCPNELIIKLEKRKEKCLNLLKHKRSQTCQLCTEVKFCSESCRNDAKLIYHSVECGDLEILYNSGLAHLALRLILFSSFNCLTNYFCKHKGETKKDREGVYGLNSDEIYGSNYETVYNLVTNSTHILADDLKVYKIASRKLVKFLKGKKVYFDKFLNDTTNIICLDCKNEIEENFQRLFLRHIQQLICNAHVITTVYRESLILDGESLVKNNSQIDTINELKIASAVYPAVSLMNHSCDPNTFSSFVGKTLIVRATRIIRKGEEIFNCYGPRVGRMNFKDRRESLTQQYYFACNSSCCSTCTIEKERLLSSLICPGCRGLLRESDEKEFMCDACQKNFGAQHKEIVFEIRNKLLQALDKGEINCVKNELDRLEMYLFKHNESLVESRDMFARMLAENGDFQLAANLLINNLESVIFIFGENSIELANEILKLVDFLLADKMIDQKLSQKITELAAKAVKIFSIHYGGDCLQIEEIASAIDSAGK